ncbi:hypothetical protein U9M48_029251 [Paspalum notatum var. saurae]|uniref:Uncharacterized protein n=1 Tax=Paspalum notatum var. saurae TaxID=547442 RepID=A0AAQ3X250_PASNO
MAVGAETMVRPFPAAAAGGGDEVSAWAAATGFHHAAETTDWPLVDPMVWGDEKRMKRELVAWAKAVASMAAGKNASHWTEASGGCLKECRDRQSSSAMKDVTDWKPTNPLDAPGVIYLPAPNPLATLVKAGVTNGLKKGPWTPEEDQKLMNYIQKHGHGSWRALPELAGLNRCGKSCRLRWTNYLRPDIKRGKFSEEEEQTILQLHSILGNKWSAISKHLPGRTDNEIKNFWNTHLRKKLIQMGIDPMTHRPRTDFFAALPQLIALANLHQLIEQQPWDGHTSGTQTQTEAVQAANLQYMQSLLQSAASIAPSPTSISSLNSLTSDLDQISLLTPQHMLSPTILENIGGNDFAGQVPHNQTPSTTRFDQPVISNINMNSDNNVSSSERCHVEGEDNNSQKSMLLYENSLPPLSDMSASNPSNAMSTSKCVALQCIDNSFPQPIGIV